MCHPTRCRTCGRTTWAGCGQHVSQVRARIPADQWCAGHPGEARPSWLQRLLDRAGHA